MLKKSDVINIYGLSPMQEGMLFHSLLDRQSGAYFEQFLICLRGRLDLDIFEKTFNRLIERYDILRTVFTYKKTQRPRQVLLKSRPAAIYFEDISHLDEKAARDYLEEFRRRDRQRGFDLTGDLLMRISMFKTAAHAYKLVWSFHHIIMDGWCFGILFADFVEIYRALRRSEPLEVRPVIPYRRYIDWLEKQDRQAGMAYWQSYLEGCDQPASLPRLKPAPGEEGQYELKEFQLEWDGPLSAGLMKLANRQQVTANTLFQALWGILLQRYNNCGDVVFGAVVSGRPPEIAGVQQMVGLFINTVPVRLKSLPGQRFPEVLAFLQEGMLQSSPHEYLPLADIQSHSSLKGRLLDHILVFENYPLEQRVSGFGIGEDTDFSIEEMQLYEQTNYDFNLVIANGDRGDRLQLRCVFNGAVYDPAFVEKVLSHFRNAARQVIQTPDIPVNGLEILSREERRQLLDETNDTAAAFPVDQTVQQLFRQQAEARPADIAVVAPPAAPCGRPGSTPPAGEIHLCYGALDRRAHRLAHRLRAGGVEACTVVGLSTGRSAEMVVGLLGILESGAAYLPLDPDFPARRIAYMLKDSCAGIVVTDSEVGLPPSVTGVHTMDEMPDSGCTIREKNPDPDGGSNPVNPAYVIYTSGSTGFPRGVVVEQRQLVNYLFGLRRRFAVSLSRCRHFATVSTISADLGNTVIYASLCFGGCLHVVSRAVLTDGGKMAAYMARRPIDCLKITPSHMAALLTTREPQPLLPRRLLILGGETLDYSLARQLERLNAQRERESKSGGCEIVNHYGPSEACIGVSTYRLAQTSPPPRSISIGKPLPNSRLYLLDHRGQPVPPGAPAELYIGGTSPAPGYLNNPELTAEKFIFTTDSPLERGARRAGCVSPLERGAPKGRGVLYSQPLNPKSQPLYKTGDLCRRRPDGNLEFLGRRDNQVKIRGFRVEPEEVALVLKSLPQVSEAVVLPRPTPSGEPQLTAYIVTEPRSRPVVNGYRRHQLPHNLAVAQLNRNETDYIYQEIFQVQAYTRHGILLHDGDCILDVGANIGLFSLFCGSLGRNLRIYAFEPNPPVFDILKTNASLYLPGARLFDCGLSARPGEGTFTFFEGFSLFSGLYADAQKEKEVVRHFMINQQKRGVAGMAELVDQADELLDGRFEAKTFAVKLDTLANVMAREDIRQVDLLKINAEKSELDVLRGIAPPDWGKIRQVVLEVDVRENLAPITSLLETHGFEWLVEQDVGLESTQLCYVYAMRPSARGRLQREGRDYTRPIPPWPDELLSDERLRERLESRLPPFMIPACFVRLERLPLTANGKLDRGALPEPGSEAGAGYTAPRHELEGELVEIWADVLDLEKERIGIDHSFFSLGGHSLRATVLVSRINKHFNIEFPLRKVFDGPTIRQLARAVRSLGTTIYENIRPVERREYYPLSSAQKRLFFLEQFEDIGTGYQIFSSLKIEGRLDRVRLESAFKALIGRHETLRTSFEMVAGEPVQRVHGEVDFKIEHYDLAAKDAKGRERKKRASSVQSSGSMDRIIEGFVRPYDLARPPLLRVGVVEGAGHPSQEGTYVLMLDMHHIVSDGTSLGILNEEMVRLYAGEELVPPKVQYRDFSAWQRQLQPEGVIRQQEEYWLRQYARAVTPVVLPYDFPRPAAFSFVGDDYLFKMEAETVGRLAALSRRFGTTLYMNLLTALNVLLYRYSGQEDVVVGSAILGRPHTDLERIIGMFVNALALRSYPDGEKCFADFLLEVKESSIKAFENQEAQFEEVVDRLKLKRDPSRNPLFDVMFVVQNFEQPRVEVHGVAFLPFHKEDRTAKFDITLFAYEVEEEIHFKLEYCTALFKRATIGRLVGHFLNVVREVGADPRLKIAEIDMLTPEEKRTLIHDFNRTLTPFPGDHTIHGLFAGQVERAPGRIALVGDDGGQHLSYGELAHRANRLAQFLLAGQGLLSNQGVGLLMDRSPDMIVTILGILQAGGAYIPLDPAYPEERLKSIIDDAALGLVISHKRYIRTLNRLQWACASFHTLLCLDSRNIYGEEEVERSELMEQKLWEYVGQRASDDITGGGWLSSYTGQPISRAEMEEYGDNILKKLAPLLHPQMKVLEVGCGSGISMFRLAPKVGLYCGCDLSPTIIDKNRERLKQEGQRNIRLACLPAHRIDRIEAGDFDLVILNSVIQCFHGHNYLRRVIGQAVKKIGKEGYLFIGDVMDQDLKADLIADLVRFRQAHGDENYTTKTDWSVELFVSRGFFLDLAAHMPEIVDVSFSPKLYTLENELTRFRYDALLRVDKANRPGPAGTTGPKHKYQLDRRVLDRYRGEREAKARLLPDPLAYIIYTSGSGGRPKGTLTTHRSVIRVVKETNYIDITPKDRLLQLSNYAFDGSVFDIFGALLNGAALVQMEKQEAAALAVERLGAFLRQAQITVFFLTTALFNTLVDMHITGLEPVRKVLFGGERVSPAHVYKAFQYLGKGRIIHVYGPTETTVYATYQPVDRLEENEQTIPIGRPLANTRTFILDRHGNPVPLGVPGELYIGGPGLAQGYLNNPQLTADKFVFTTDSPLERGARRAGCVSPLERGAPKGRGVLYSQILYRTGDLCRWLPTGTIEFIGRLDQQVKIRGFRIEPAEVEAQLRQHPDIREAVVTVRGDGGDRSLCAYVVSPHPPTSPTNKTSFREYLSGHLPDYMIPRQVVALERIPLTANSKVDQTALPEPEVPLGRDFVAPRDRLEEQLAAIWSDILAIPRGRIGVDSDFFELGGHSLKATVLTNRVHRELAVKLPLAEVFKTPCIRQLAAYIRGLMKEAGSSFSAIAALEKRDHYPLSSAQKRLYVLQHMKSDGTGYNMPAVLSIRGRVEGERLASTFEKLIRRHESLRTAFGLYRDEPVQRVHEAVAFEIEYFELAAKDAKGREGTHPSFGSTHPVPLGAGHPSQEGTHTPPFGHPSQEGIVREFVRAFDLARPPLLRVGLVRGHPSREGTYILMVDMHHIIADGISLGILMRDFMALYGGRELPPLRLHYKDFGGWQNRLFGTAEIKAQQAYWQAQFDGHIPVIDLPLDYPRPVVQRFEGDGLQFKLARQQTENLRRILRQTDTTLFMVLLAIFNILLSRLSGQEDIVIGTPVGGRRHADLEPIIGMFVNTLALRNCPNGEKSFGEFLAEVRAAAIAAFENQDYPFEELVEGLAVNRDVGRNPLFDVMLSLQNVEIPELAVPGLELAPGGYRDKISLFDMTLTGIEGEEEIFLTIDYSDHLFKRQTIGRFAGYFQKIVDAVIDDPGTGISEIAILTPREIKQLVYRLNDTGAPYPADRTLHQLFREQAERTPDYGAVALADKLLSYRELNRRSDQGAALLREKGIKTGAIVGLRLARSPQMIIAILSVLKSGSAYLPLDPDDPPERIHYILGDSNAAALLTPESPEMGIVDPVQRFDPLVRGAGEARGVLAYVIYTSGSTGRPKGVMVEHRAAVNLAFCQKRRFCIDTTDHILQFSTCAFDASVEQIFIALFSGALLVLIDKDTLLDQDRFSRYLTERQVTHLHAVPFFLQNIDFREMGSLRRVIAGGDVCPLSLARQLNQGVDLYNEYGPTETTVTSVELKVGEVDKRWLRLPIGRPIDNTRIYILDRRGRPLPCGVTAEICIGGDGLARGYLNNPELTAEKFIYTTISPLERGAPKGRGVLYSQILYRTGDLGRFLPDGNLDFLGRIDHQVKIRGFRIEPAEIETHLTKHPGIQNAVVIHRQDDHQEKYLTAYIIPQTNRTNQTTELRQYLAEFLPDHMIPAHFIPLPHFPLTRSGKIDRKRLPEPKVAAQKYTAPRRELEETLVKIWSEVLGIDRTVIGIDQSFFALGGHSLKATILASKIHKSLQVEMPLVEIFRSPTIRELAAYLTGIPAYEYASIRPVEKREYYALSPAQKRLYVLHQMAPDTMNYNMPYRFYLAADMEVERLEPAFKTLIGRHESLRTSFGVVGEEPVQRIHEGVDFKIEYYDLAAKDAKGREGTHPVPLGAGHPSHGSTHPAPSGHPSREGTHTPPFGHPSQEGTHTPPFGHPSREGTIREFVRPFDLSRPPLLRVGLVRGVLMLDMHHIVSDGTSHGILEREFMSFLAGKELPGLRLQYKDYARWQNSEEQQALVRRQESYWLRRFTGDIPVLNLPADYPRPLMQSFEGRSVNFVLGADETATLRRLGDRANATLYMSLLAVFNILLSKLGGQEDIVVGTPVAGRRHADLERIVGMFVNTLAIRSAPVGHKSFAEFLGEVKERTLAAFENQEYPFENLVDNAAVQRDTSRNPLFDVMLNLLNQSDDGLARPHPEELADINGYEHIEGSAKFDLNWTVMEGDQTLLVNVEYGSRLFKPATIERLIRYFKQVLAALGKDGAIKLSAIVIITAGEKQQILYAFNHLGDRQVVEADQTICRLFEARLARCPDCTALVYRGSLVTYRELNERSNRLARRLTAKGAGPEVVVGLMVQRSPEMVIAVLGILQAGAAYLPIDPGYPPERIRFMLEDSGVRIVITGGEGQLLLQAENPGLDRGVCPRGRASGPSNPVYIIYTSGSSGRPKGVMLVQKNVVNLIQYQYRCTNIDFSRVLQFTTISFDVSFQEIFSTLLYGGSLVLIPPDILKDIPRLFLLVEAQQIATLFLPASFLKFVFNEEAYADLFPRGIRHIVAAGEQVIVTPRLRAYLKTHGVYLHNHYGPSEAHVVTALTMDPSAPIPGLPSIGRPLMNTAIYIVDRYFHLQPPGIGGELLIGGIQVGRGYLNNPELTADKFITAPAPAASHQPRATISPFTVATNSPLERGARRAGCVSPLERGAPKGRGVLYRTGDLARFLPDGTIEFLGRIDHQVKIRGFRIEPAGIESLLLRHEAVKEAVVIARDESQGEKYLTAYIVPQTNRTSRTSRTSPAKLRQYLAEFLPDYMIPAHFVELPHIPLTPNGKVDRGSLPEPEFPAGHSRTAPRDEVEERLASLWSGLLGIAKGSLGIDDNFFALGGHSLKATVLVARLHQEMEVNLPLAEVFKTPTIRGVARYMRGAAAKKFVPIEAVEKREYYPLSSAQRRLYILQQMDRESTVYNLPLAVGLGFGFDGAKLTTVFRQLIRRHESLRTAFTVAAEEPVQCIHDSVDFEIEYFDLTAKDAKGREGTHPSHGSTHPAPSGHPSREGTHTPPFGHPSREGITRGFVRAFDLSRPPLLRVGLMGGHPSRELTHPVPLGAGHPSQEGKYVLLVDMHHIVGDGVSLGLLVEEFQAVLRGEPLPRLRLQYKDYARWQSRQGLKERHRRQQRYWLSRFADEIPVLRLPYDYPRPPVQRFEGDSLGFTIDAPETKGLQHLASVQGVTLFMLLLSLFNILLSKLSGQEDIVVGTPVAGRRHADLEHIVGMFVNTLTLRSEPAGDKGLREFLSAVKAGALGAFENQEYPFEDLVEALSVPRQAGRNPLFDVMIALQNMGEYAGGQSGAVDFKNPVSRFDMTWNGFEGQGQLFFTVEYCTLLFKGETIARFVDYFKRIITQVLAEPGIRLAAIEMLSPQERKQVLFDFNDTASAYPRHQTIPQLFALQVQRLPHGIAVVWEDRCLSYRSLNREAERLAGDLTNRGIRAETAVAIRGRRSVEMIAGLLGILKAGGLYVPLDPEYPQDRVRYMLADSGAEIVVSDGEARPPVPAENPGLDEGSGLLDRTSTPSSLAYIIYTSGSTGQPRGVMVSHGSVVQLVKNIDYIELAAGKRLLPTGALEFDASTFEIWGSLLNGLTLCLLPEAEILSPNRFKARLYRYDIDIMWLTSPLFNQLLDADEELFGCLDYLLVGGDVVSPAHINRLRSRYPELKVINGYGPTENTTFSTTFLIDRDYRGPIPIGRPIANSTAYILDRHRCQVPLGVSGELWVGGDGLARGYLNNPDLTADRFVNIAAKGREGTPKTTPSRFTAPTDSPLERGAPKGRGVSYPQPLTPKSQILYRTGDLARFLPDGNIEFLGRLDHQVKIRGFRIEPAEIENHLRRHQEISDTVVILHQDDQNEKYLTAYVVLSPVGAFDKTHVNRELRKYLLQFLPDYMIPAYFVELEHIPLTPRGKIDHKRLPAPEIKAHDTYAPPQNRSERLLLNIWSKVLGIEEKEIGVNDDFFELGGHSLKAAMMAAKLQKEFGLTLPLLEIFKSPTIRMLAKVVKSYRPEISPFPTKSKNLVLLRQGTAPGRHLFFIHAGSGEVDAYLELCKDLSSAFNCWGIRADRLCRYSPRNLTIEKTAAGYIEKIRAVQARGPYCIAGWCIGGTVAFEMVGQLERMGETVDLLALINTVPPQAFPAAGGGRFSLKSELELLAACLPHVKGREAFRGVSRLNRLWPAVIHYLESSEAGVHTLRHRIPANWLRAIPAADRLPVREFIYYLNVVRTFDRARNTYIPRKKINTPLHFFSAVDEESPAKERWSNYTNRPVFYTDIGGDHFSLLQAPRVEGLTGMFNCRLESKK